MKTIERLKELEKAATPIWGVVSEVTELCPERGTAHVFHATHLGRVVATFKDSSTALAYVAARNALPALLAVAEAQAAEIAAWRLQTTEAHWRGTLPVGLMVGTDDAIRALEGGD